jgi:hypothetical protein
MKKILLTLFLLASVTLQDDQEQLAFVYEVTRHGA